MKSEMRAGARLSTPSKPLSASATAWLRSRRMEATQISIQSSLESNRIGYQVGGRINIDVLNAKQQLHSTLRDLAKARLRHLDECREIKISGGYAERSRPEADQRSTGAVALLKSRSLSNVWDRKELAACYSCCKRFVCSVSVICQNEWRGFGHMNAIIDHLRRIFCQIEAVETKRQVTQNLK